MSLFHRYVPKAKGTQGSEIYTQSAVAVKTAAAAVWATLGGVGAAPYRATLLHLARCSSDPAVPAVVRTYNRLFNACVQTNSGLIHRIVCKFYAKGAYRGLDQDDLFQEGAMGLQRALETYDHTKASFATYAYLWIFQAISRAIMNGCIVHVPVRVHDIVAKAERGGTHIATRPKYLDEPLPAHGATGAYTLGDSLVSPLPSPEQEVQQREDQDTVSDMLDRLTDRERRVIQGRYVEGKTLEEVGAALDVTRERARQIECSALEKIRDCVHRGRRGFNAE